MLTYADAPLLLGEHAEAGIVGIVSDILSYPADVLQLREALPRRCALRDWQVSVKKKFLFFFTEACCLCRLCKKKKTVP